MENEIKEQPISTPEAEMICENCHKKVKFQAGRNWKIYYGNTIERPKTSYDSYGVRGLTVTATKFKIAGSESVFVCHECFLAKTISHHRSNEIALFVIGFMTLCLLIGYRAHYLGHQRA